MNEFIDNFLKELRKSLIEVNDKSKEISLSNNLQKDVEFFKSIPFIFNKVLVLSDFFKKYLNEIELTQFNLNIDLLKESIEKVKNVDNRDAAAFYLVQIVHIQNFIHSLVMNKEMQIKTKENDKIREFDEVFNFLKEKKIIRDNWAPSVLLLQSIETVVNKKLLDNGINWRKVEHFKDRFEKLNIKEKWSIILNESFWNLRTDVLHDGYSPNDEELEIIKLGSKIIIKKLLN